MKLSRPIHAGKSIHFSRPTVRNVKAKLLSGGAYFLFFCALPFHEWTCCKFLKWQSMMEWFIDKCSHYWRLPVRMAIWVFWWFPSVQQVTCRQLEVSCSMWKEFASRETLTTEKFSFLWDFLQIIHSFKAHRKENHP